MNNNLLLSLTESILSRDFCVATYYVSLPPGSDPYEKAKNMAVGQTIGTWIPVPGITEEMRQNYMGKIVNIYDLQPDDLESPIPAGSGLEHYIFQIAYPVANFENSIPLLLTTLLGNDASTSVQAKLIDLYLPKRMLESFPGPAYGIEGIRSLCKVKGRPILLNMIKPCTGFSPEVGARIFYSTALGGIDLIKDDELLGNPSYCPLTERIRAYNQASRAAFEETGKETIYVPNITDHVSRLVDHAKAAQEAGAKIVMVNFAATGFGALQMLREEIDLPIMGHYAGAGPYYEGPTSGVTSSLVLGKLPRLLGADIVMINTPYGGYPIKRSRYLRTAQELTLALPGIRPALPSCGGGVNPGMAETLIRDLGSDIILAPGGAIQGHPMGSQAGVRAMFAAVEAAMNGTSLEEAARQCPELETIRHLWKKEA